MYGDGRPVIGLSGRGKRLDKVLFTLLHEVAHILRGHVDADHYVVGEIDHVATQNAQEKEVDVAAAELRFPDGFPRIPRRISGPWVDKVAAELGVARIVVVGYLQHEHCLEWRATLAKNAPSVGDALETWK